MNDKEVALLVLEIAARADGGCVPCVQGCVDEALYQHPNLPWDEVIPELRPDAVRKEIAAAIESARSWLADGNPPRHSERANPDSSAS